jgi:hypothetical protein
MSYTGAGYVGARNVKSYLKSTEHGGMVQTGGGGGWNIQGEALHPETNEPVAQYPSGFRFIPDPNALSDDNLQKLKETKEVSEALKELHRLESNIKGDHYGAYSYERFWTSEQKVAYEQEMQVQRDIVQKEKDRLLAQQEKEKAQIFNILPQASAESDISKSLSDTSEPVISMPRVPGQTISERGAGASVPIAEQQPQTDIFGNVIPAYEPPTTISGTRGQIKYADPSTESGLRSNPLSDIGQVVYGTLQDVFTPVAETIQQVVVDPIAETLGIPPTTDHIPPPETTQEEPTQQPIPPVIVDPTCPARVQIISNLTNVVAGEGLFDCATIQRYEDHPDYRVVYVNGQEAIPTQQPEQEQLAPILQCADVYRWENGNVSRSTGQFTLSQLQGYISQGLMIRDCNTTRPTDQEVKDHYGIVTTSEVEPPPVDEEEPTTDHIPPDVNGGIDTTTTTDHIPPDVTVTPSEPTNFGMAGILFAGVLALPILAGFGKWK